MLDDLATAVLLHGQVDQSPVRERLLRPVLERAAAIVEAALASATPQPAPPQLPWLMTENRPGLRSLFRLFQLTEDSGSDEDVARSAARLLEINPNDNHGLRDVLSNLYVKLEKHEACVALYERYPEDAVPDLALDAALALYRLGRAKAAGKALRRAARLAPEAMPYLLDKRIARPPLHDAGVTMDGPDRGWFYRKAMRSEWLRTPGALDWATTLLR